MTLLRLILTTLFIFLLLSIASYAESRWVIGVQNGAGAGLIGIELEKEWGGFSSWIATGYVPEAIGAALGLRVYFSSRPVSRFFIEGFGASIGVSTYLGMISGSYTGIGGGFEWRLTKLLRLAISGGYGLAKVAIFTKPMSYSRISFGFNFHLL